jgi:hypothetical protein
MVDEEPKSRVRNDLGEQHLDLRLDPGEPGFDLGLQCCHVLLRR